MNYEENNTSYDQVQTENTTAEPIIEETVTPPQPEKKANNVFGIISLVCGILAWVMCCCCYYIAPILGIAAIVLAFVDKSKNGKMSVMGIIGLIAGALGIVGVVVTIVMGVAGTMLGAAQGY